MYAVSEYPHQFRFSLSVNPPIQSVHSADGSLAAFPSQEFIAVPEKREIRTVLTRTCHDSKLRFYVTKTDTLKEFRYWFTFVNIAEAAACQIQIVYPPRFTRQGQPFPPPMQERRSHWSKNDHVKRSTRRRRDGKRQWQVQQCSAPKI